MDTSPSPTRPHEADRLVGAESPAAAKIEIHAIKVVGAGITMKPMEKGLGLPPDTAITLKPRGYHLWIELKAPLAQGQKVPGDPDVREGGTQQSSSWWSRRRARSATTTLMEGQPG